MILRLLKKLQITTRKITDNLPGPCGITRYGMMLAAVVTMAAAQTGLAEQRVQQAYYQEAASGASGVQQVSYQTVSHRSVSSSVSSGVSSTGKQLSWVSISAPESRSMKEDSAMAISTEVPVTGGVQLTSGTEASKKSVLQSNTLHRVSDDAAAPAAAAPAGDAALDPVPMTDIDMNDISLDAPLPEATLDVAVPATEIPTSGGANEGIPAAVNTENSEPRAIEESAKTAPAPADVPKMDEMELPASKLPTPDSGITPSATLEGATPEGSQEDPWKRFDNPRAWKNTPCDFGCSVPRDMMKPIDEVTNEIDPPDGSFPKDCLMVTSNERFPVRQFAGTHVTWTAANTCHNPLYFEQPAVERYGHSMGPVLQPILSGAEFLITVPALPYLMAMDPVNECQYSLGYYRPGSCAPFKWNPVPFTLRAAIAEGGVATALVFLIP